MCNHTLTEPHQGSLAREQRSWNLSGLDPRKGSKFFTATQTILANGLQVYSFCNHFSVQCISVCISLNLHQQLRPGVKGPELGAV